MKTILACATAVTLLTLAACGSSEKTTVVLPQASPTAYSVEHMCKNGYDNASRSCY